MRTNVINLLNRVPGHNCRTFFVLHRTKCKPMHFEWERFSDVTLTLTLILTPNPIQNTLLYISFCVALKKLENRALGHDSIDE